MQILCIGGGGRICREAVLDLVQFSDFRRTTVADCDARAAGEVVRWLDDPRVDAATVDVNDRRATVDLMRGYSLVVDGLPISRNDRSAQCMLEAGVHGINLNGMSYLRGYVLNFLLTSIQSQDVMPKAG